MTQEYKEILIRDLCSRLPYGVKCKFDLDGYLSWNPDYKKKFDESSKVIPGLYEKISNKVYTLESYPCNGRFFLYGLDGVDEWGVPVEFIKPYLRPMSSMTDEEKDELYSTIEWCADIDENGNLMIDKYTGEKIYHSTIIGYVTWLLVNHFDFNKLIEKDLAELWQQKN